MTDYLKIAPFRKRRTRRAKARPPARPEWLTGAAAEAWEDLGPRMAQAGWLDELGAWGFALICRLVARSWELSAEVDRLGTEEATAKGIYRAWLDTVAELREWHDNYFMSPLSRAQAGVEPAPGA